MRHQTNCKLLEVANEKLRDKLSVALQENQKLKDDISKLLHLIAAFSMERADANYDMGLPHTEPTVTDMMLEEEHAQPSLKDPVNPDYYGRHKVSPIDLIESYGMLEGFCLGNAIKYIARAREKNGTEDWQKAQWYLNRWLCTVQEDTELNEFRDRCTAPDADEFERKVWKYLTSKGVK